MFSLFKALFQNLVGLVIIQLPLFVEKNRFIRVDELKTEIICKDLSVQILSARRSIVKVRIFFKILLNCRKFIVKRQLKSKYVNNFIISCFDFLQLFAQVAAFNRNFISLDQHVRDFRIF